MLDRVGRKLLAALLLAAALAAGLWLARHERARPPEFPLPAPESPAAPPRAAIEPSAEPEPVREVIPDAPTQPAARQSGIALTLRFVGPDGGVLEPARARVRLTDPQGRVHERTVADASTVQFEDLASERYAAAVEAPGFMHRAEEIRLSRGLGQGEPSESLVLWPEGWVAVVVEAQDGRPLRTLADSLGLDPRNLFVDAFVARARGQFHKPPVYQQWQITESVVGALFLSDPPPFPVELLFHGRLVGEQLLEAGAKEIVFRLGSGALEQCFARLRLRVLEAQGDTPVAGAETTLRADTSAHRRSDQEDVRTSEEGRVEFARIVPGRYELNVQRGESLYQDRIDLAPGEQRDLGIVRLPNGAPLRIRVVDERGEPQQAWLEIGPFEAGKNVHDLYPPMLHHYSDQRGQGKLPMPAKPSIVRAQQIRPDSLSPSGLMSASVRIDPANPPGGEVTLVILDEARAKLHCKVPEARTLQLVDESGLIVLADPLNSDRWKDGRRELVIGRGRYELRLLGSDGAVLYQRAVEWRAGEQQLELP